MRKIPEEIGESERDDRKSLVSTSPERTGGVLGMFLFGGKPCAGDKNRLYKVCVDAGEVFLIVVVLGSVLSLKKI